MTRTLLWLVSVGLGSASMAVGSIASGQKAPPDRSLTLWYDQPATSAMNEALPIGNGRIGGVVLGGVDHERLQFNEDSLWTGDENPSGDDATMGAYQTFGDLLLTSADTTPPTAYRRELNLATAAATTEFTQGSTHVRREAFASAPDQVIVLRWTASAPSAITGAVALHGGHHEPSTARANGITFSGSLDNGMAYAAEARVVARGGVVRVDGDHLSLDRCDEVTIFLAAATNYAMDEATRYRSTAIPSDVVNRRVEAAAAKGFDAIRADQRKDFASLFDRVSLNLGESTPAQRAMPTNLRKAAASATVDPELESLLFQYGRYLMISSSRPGGLPANLQGLWNDSNAPPWHSDYHANINIEMNYWPAEVTNLAECHTPFFDLIRSQLGPWRKATAASIDFKTPAGEMTQRGFAIRTSHNITGGMGWNWDKTANAWYCQHLWEHFAFGQDKTFLREVALPIMQETAKFWADHLKTLTDGSLVVPDGWSPEHGPHEDGCNYNQEIVWDLFNNYVDACAALGDEAPAGDGDKFAKLRDRLTTPKIGKWGQLQEWMTDRDDAHDHHRHTSHLFGVYPGRQISVEKTPLLAAAARVSLDARGTFADSDVREWSFAWRASLYARLHDGEQAHAMLMHFLSDRNSCANLFGLHPPMQLDGNFGVTAAVAEMLLQSQDGDITLLPALPLAWSTGHATGLRARGGVTVDLSWSDGQLMSATLHRPGGGRCVVHYRASVFDLQIPATGRASIEL